MAAVELKAIAKSFGSLRANHEISFRAEAGTLHAIIGENGAGKSTAMKILYGMYRPDEGEIFVDGVKKIWTSPAQAIASGIGMVHQHFMLAEPYTALENIVLGVEASRFRGWPKLFSLVDFQGARAAIEGLITKYGLRVDLDAKIQDLSVGDQQRIEILKLLYRHAKILILDEPTAVLTPQETAELFVNLKRLCAEGKTVLIITHKLKEVMAIADHVTIFRAGRVVGSRKISETHIEELATLMVGRKVNLTAEVKASPQSGGPPALELKNITLRGLHRHHLDQLSFKIFPGEIVGIAGVEGNGQSELLRVLSRPEIDHAKMSGEITMLGRTTFSSARKSQFLSALEIKNLGVGLIPEDRHRQGLLLDRSLEDNFLLGLQRRAPFSKNGCLSFAAIRKKAERAFEEYDVRPRVLLALARNLSGGNQQKLIIAREFEREPKLLIAAQPTRGVDIGAIEFIHRRIVRAARDEGAAVLLISSELDEILALSDRIFILSEGKFVAEFKRGEATEEKIGLSMGAASHV